MYIQHVFSPLTFLEAHRFARKCKWYECLFCSAGEHNYTKCCLSTCTAEHGPMNQIPLHLPLPRLPIRSHSTSGYSSAVQPDKTGHKLPFARQAVRRMPCRADIGRDDILDEWSPVSRGGNLVTGLFLLQPWLLLRPSNWFPTPNRCAAGTQQYFITWHSSAQWWHDGCGSLVIDFWSASFVHTLSANVEIMVISRRTVNKSYSFNRIRVTYSILAYGNSNLNGR